MTVKVIIVLCLSSPIFIGCSSCSNNGNPDTGTGTPDGDSDSDTDIDTDSDADSDTDSDIDAGPVVTSDAGPWDWEDIPEGEDCGEGCVQLTFSEEVRMHEWDVWENLLAFKDETTRTFAVDIENKEQIVIPNFYPEYEVGPAMDASTFYPATVNGKTVCYSMNIYEGNDQSSVICADLESEIQTLIYIRHEQSEIWPNPAKYIDLYENHLVAMGGCGGLESWPLCYFDTATPNLYEELAPHSYGSHNSLWGDIVVYYTGGYDIRGYDLSKATSVTITNDAYYQFMARIHGSRVVYMDLRYGTGDPFTGNWNHSAVFMHDLETGKKTQITNAEWIAAYPDVYENIIIWADYRDSDNPNNKNSLEGVQIWGYNLETEQEFKITDILDRPKTTPRIWEDKVFVLMYKETPGESAIYMFDLPVEAQK